MWFIVSVILALLLVAAYMFVPWYYTHYLPTQHSVANAAAQSGASYPSADASFGTEKTHESRRTSHRHRSRRK